MQAKTILAAVLLLLATVASAADTFTGRVVKVIDGDTITLLVDGNRQVKIRLSEIDAPERRQAFGRVSTEAPANMVFAKDVRIVDHGKDKYGRTIGDVFIGDTNVNYATVALGLAWQYRRYSKSERLAELEREARDARRGLWRDNEPAPPWEYRAIEREKRSRRD